MNAGGGISGVALSIHPLICPKFSCVPDGFVLVWTSLTTTNAQGVKDSFCVKWAVIVVFLSMMMSMGFVFPDTSPVHSVKNQVAFGCAVNRTVAP